MSPSSEPDALDEAIFEAIADMEDEGASPSVEALRESFPGQEERIRAVLTAHARYTTMVAEARDELVEEPSLPPGTRLGGYVVEGLLGRGGMGEVLRARPAEGDGPAVALKVLSSALVARDPSAVERFRREAELAATVRHPNLAEVLDSGQDGDALFLAMRLVEGRTLSDVLHGLARRRREGSSEHVEPAYVARVVALAREVAEAVATLHRRGLVHRDIKPGNILLEGSTSDGPPSLAGRPVLVDHGLLRPVEATDVTSSRTLLGTPAYVSPEGRLGREVDARADVFSLGALLHDLLALTPPGDRRVASAGLSEVRALNPGVDRRLAAIVGMALEDEPALRYRDAGELGQDLARYADGRRVRALPRNPLRRLWRRARRNPIAAVSFGSAAALLGALGFGLVFLLGVRVAELKDAAREGLRMEQEGNLPGAWEVVKPLYAARWWARLVPGLEPGIELAVDLHGRDPTATACELVRDSPGPPERWHPSLREELLTPATADPALLRFLVGELDPAWCLARRAAAAETLAYYLLVHPRDWNEPLLDEPTDEDLVNTLLQSARDPADDPHEERLRTFSVSALGGLTGDSAFDGLLALLEDDEFEVWRLAMVATDRHWHRLRLDDSTEFEPLRGERLETWAVRTHLQTMQRIGDLTHETARDCESVLARIAWTCHELGLDPQAGEWGDEDLTAHLDACVDAFTGLAAGKGIPETASPAFAEATRQFHEILEEQFRVGRSEKERYDLQNLWSTQAEAAAWKEFLLDPDEACTRGEIDFGTWRNDGRPAHSGLASGLSWKACVPESSSHRVALEFQTHVHSRLTMRFRIPADAKRATIELHHAAPKRPMLPHHGSARVTIGVGPTADSLTRRLPEVDSERMRFRVSKFDLQKARAARHGNEDELPIHIDLVSGNTAYWVYRCTVVYDM